MLRSCRVFSSSISISSSLMVYLDKISARANDVISYTRICLIHPFKGHAYEMYRAFVQTLHALQQTKIESHAVRYLHDTVVYRFHVSLEEGGRPLHP